jgi:hypothetical protein
MARKTYWPERQLETFPKGNDFMCVGYTWCPKCHNKKLDTKKRARTLSAAFDEASTDLRRKLRDHLRKCPAVESK